MILYIVFSFQENLCKGLFCLFKVWKDLQPALPACIQPFCVLCATASGLCCGADAQGGDLDVCTLAQFLLCSCCHFFPLLMPELCSVLGVGSRVSGKGRPEAPPCSWCQVWCMADAGTSHRETWVQGMKQVCRSSAPLPLPFSLIPYSFKRAKLDFCIWIYPREMDSYSTFLLPFL